jgi:hypothetical protein
MKLKFYSELSDYVHDIIIGRYEEISDIELDIPSGASALPPDGQWIEEGIELKLKKYGAPDAVKDLTLVIDLAGFVGNEQIEAFRAAHPEATLPFREIWIAAFDGMACLKKKQP